MLDTLKEIAGLLTDASEWMQHSCVGCSGADVQRQRLQLAKTKVNELRAQVGPAALTDSDRRVMRQAAIARRDHPAIDKG